MTTEKKKGGAHGETASPKKEERIPVDKYVFNELKYMANLKPENAHKKLLELLPILSASQTRTSQQNKALHVDCQKIADKLNDAGKDMRVVLKPDYFVPWSMESVKEHIFRPVMKAMLKKESTTELEKHGEIEKVHDVIMRELGQKFGIEYHDFPHDPQKKAAFEAAMGIRRPFTPVRHAQKV